MPKGSNGALLVRIKHGGSNQTYHRGSRLGGAGTTSILGSKTIREATGGSKETGVRVWAVSNCVATTVGLLLAGEGEGNKVSLLSPRHLWCRCMLSANLITDAAESPSRSRVNKTRASASVTESRLCNRSWCSSHCICSASFLRFIATMGVASTSATYTQGWPWLSQEEHVGRTPSHL